MPPIRSIRDQTTCLCRVPVNVHRRQPELCREIRQWQPIETPASGSRERPLLCGREPASSRTADERGLRDLGGGQNCVGLQCVGAVLGLAC